MKFYLKKIIFIFILSSIFVLCSCTTLSNYDDIGEVKIFYKNNISFVEPLTINRNSKISDSFKIDEVNKNISGNNKKIIDWNNNNEEIKYDESITKNIILTPKEIIDNKIDIYLNQNNTIYNYKIDINKKINETSFYNKDAKYVIDKGYVYLINGKEKFNQVAAEDQVHLPENYIFKKTTCIKEITKKDNTYYVHLINGNDTYLFLNKKDDLINKDLLDKHIANTIKSNTFISYLDSNNLEFDFNKKYDDDVYIKVKNKKDIYKYNIINDKVIISSLDESKIKKEYINYLYIPEQIEGKYVNEIGISCFESLNNLKYIYIPNSIKKINEYAFDGCFNLEKIDSDTTLQIKEIGKHAFSRNYKLTNIFDLSYVEIIGEKAFSKCSSLLEVKLGAFLNTISNNIFNDCINIIKVDLSDTLITEIPDSMFNNNINLKEVMLNKSIKKINKNAFFNCYNLKNINLENSVEYILDNAFKNALSLESVININNLKIVGNNAFMNCYNLKDIDTSKLSQIKSNSFNSCISLKKLDLNNLIYLGDKALYDCINLEEIQIKNSSIQILHKNTFYNNEALKEITLPNFCKTISNYTFNNCYTLSKIFINENLEELKSYAFNNLISLTSIEIPKSIKILENYIFNNCLKLQKIIINKEKNSIEKLDKYFNLIYKNKYTSVVYK